MRTTKNLLITCLLFCILSKLNGQDLHIHYDAQTQQLQYLYNGKKISSPKVKKGGSIYLHIDNYNNYIYDLEIQEQQHLIQIPSSSNNMNVSSSLGSGNLFSLLGGLSSGAGDGFKLLGNLSMGGDNDDDTGFGFAGAETESTASKLQQQQQLQLQQAKYAMDEILENMASTENSFYEVQNKISDYKQDLTIRDAVMKEVVKIKRNPNIPPGRIKKLTKAYLEKILDVEQVEDLNLEYILEKTDHKKQLQKQLRKLETDQQRYDMEIKKLKKLNEDMDGFGFASFELIALQNTAKSVYSNGTKVNSTVENGKQEIKTLMDNAQKESIQKYTDIWYEYEALSANDFSYVYRTEAMGDQSILQVNFTAKDSLKDSGVPPMLSLAPIRVPVFGGVKVNASVGISFGQFFNEPQSFFVRDSTIRVQTENSFNPYVTSFIHFYSQSAKSVSFGGSLGIGVPISSSNGLQSATFFFGPSLMFGKSERLVLNFGLMGGRQERLSNGYQEGDRFISDADVVPTHFPYELGYFVGVSFNLVK